MPEEQRLGELGSGEPVIRRATSRLHIRDQRLRADVLSRVSAKDEFIVQQIDYPEPIGTTSYVETTAVDRIVFARELGHPHYSRFVLDREPEPTNSVVVILKLDERCGENGQRNYVLLSDSFGTIVERWPWATQDTVSQSRSIRFWMWHAKVTGGDTTILCYRCQKPFIALQALPIHSVLICPQCEADRRTILGTNHPPTEWVSLRGWGPVKAPVLAAR